MGYLNNEDNNGINNDDEVKVEPALRQDEVGLPGHEAGEVVEVDGQLGLDRHLLVLGVLGQGESGFLSLGEWNSCLWGNRILVFGSRL